MASALDTLLQEMQGVGEEEAQSSTSTDDSAVTPKNSEEGEGKSKKKRRKSKKRQRSVSSRKHKKRKNSETPEVKATEEAEEGAMAGSWWMPWGTNGVVGGAESDASSDDDEPNVCLVPKAVCDARANDGATDVDGATADESECLSRSLSSRATKSKSFPMVDGDDYLEPLEDTLEDEVPAGVRETKAEVAEVGDERKVPFSAGAHLQRSDTPVSGDLGDSLCPPSKRGFLQANQSMNAMAGRALSDTPKKRKSRKSFFARRRTVNDPQQSPRRLMVNDNLNASVPSRKKSGLLRSISAKGMSMVTKKKDLAHLSAFEAADTNLLSWSQVDPKSTDYVNDMRFFSADTDKHWHECGAVQSTVFQRKLVVENREIDSTFFQDHLHEQQFSTYVARNLDHPWVMAVGKVKRQRKQLIYVTDGEATFNLTAPLAMKPKEILAQVNRYSPKLLPAQFEQVKGKNTTKDFLRLEQFTHRPQYTFGVIYCADGQLTETEMYSNETGSPDFNLFLSLLGDKVELKGWDKFTGGLDVHRNKTGTHSYYTALDDFEVMYHVSTMLPFMAHDEQKLERKRHIGNDILVIIYKEGNQRIDPALFDSHFNTVFLIVERLQADEQVGGSVSYRFEFCYKKDVPHPPRPALPRPPAYKAGSETREILVTKLINAERVALKAPDFANKLVRTRRHMIDFMVELFFRGS